MDYLPMQLLDNKEQLFTLLTRPATLLTPNKRLSESILQNYVQHYNHPTVEKPKCMPYNLALIKAYESLHFLYPEKNHPILLTEAQCQFLWRKIIKATPEITYSEGLLQSVLSAWKHSQQWQIDVADKAFQYTAQTRQFQEWWSLFDKQLEQNHLITEYQLVSYLLQKSLCSFAKNLVWVCFDDFTPEQTLLQKHLAQLGTKQYQYDLADKPSHVELLPAAHQKEEYQQLLAWLDLKIQQGDQRIGVVVPNLEQESNNLQRIFANHFNKELFNLSLGQALSEFPIIAHALCWLKLDSKTLSATEATLLLQSPYLSAAKTEFTARSEYLQDSVLLTKAQFPMHAFIKTLDNKVPLLANLLSLLTPYPQEAKLQDWVFLFQERLTRLGFPGEYGVTSENYQCLNRFTSLFDEFRQFSLLSPNLTKEQALEALTHLAANTIFQAEKTNALIQISGLLEASGCEFDSLWMMGLTDQCLPQKVQLSAFIPTKLQRELKMPHSLPLRELQLAQKTLHRLQNSARSLVFSYAKLQGDTPNLPCSLILSLPNYEPLPIPSLASNANLILVHESFQVPLDVQEQISGGTAILANQAKCPFKAFAEHRLSAKTSLQMSYGLDNKERGQIIHKVMELLWQKLESQHQLVHLSPDLLEDHIAYAIEGALTPLKQNRPDLFSTPIHDVELIRLKRLVHACLDWEKQRPPFTVAALEHSYTLNLAGLEIQVRVDRLDTVADKKWVIDYKSSLPPSKPWNEDRPKESQLLLYALLDEDINTLILLQLKTGKISCAGLSENKEQIQGISYLKSGATWQEYRDIWQQQLTDLAVEFQAGHCPPKPAQASICQQCDFQNLCRLQTETMAS